MRKITTHQFRNQENAFFDLTKIEEKNNTLFWMLGGTVNRRNAQTGALSFISSNERTFIRRSLPDVLTWAFPSFTLATSEAQVLILSEDSYDVFICFFRV